MGSAASEIMLGRVARVAAGRVSARAPARVAQRRLMSAEADQYQALTKKDAFLGTAHEQPAGSYENTIHEQDELWWDDGTAQREPIFDSDHIPMSEAVPMFFAGMGLFAAVAGVHKFILDPEANRPTVPREMPEAHIWEKPYQGEAEEDEDEED